MSEAATTPAPASAPAPNGAGAPPRATLDNFEALIAHNMRQPAAPAAAPAAPAPAAQRPAPPGASPALPPPPGAEPDAGDPELGLGAEELPSEPGAEPEGAELAHAILDEVFHGRKGREILEAIKGGKLLAELYDLPAPIRLNGQEQEVPIREALAGYQRNLDYTRGKQEARALQQRAQRTLDDFHGMVGAWDTGASLRRDLEAMGKMKGFHEAAVAYAAERVQDAKWQRENPEAWRLNQKMREQEAELDAVKRQLQQRPAQGPSPEQQRQQQQLEQLIPGAFQKHGLKPELRGFPEVRGHFASAFAAALDSTDDMAEAVDRAAESTSQFLAELAERHQAALAAKGGGAPDAPARNPSPLPARGAAPATAARPPVYAKSLTPGDMDEYLRGLRKRGR